MHDRRCCRTGAGRRVGPRAGRSSGSQRGLRAPSTASLVRRRRSRAEPSAWFEGHGSRAIWGPSRSPGGRRAAARRGEVSRRGPGIGTRSASRRCRSSWCRARWPEVPLGSWSCGRRTAAGSAARSPARHRSGRQGGPAGGPVRRSRTDEDDRRRCGAMTISCVSLLESPVVASATAGRRYARATHPAITCAFVTLRGCARPRLGPRPSVPLGGDYVRLTRVPQRRTRRSARPGRPMAA